MAGDHGLPLHLTFPCAPAPGARAVRHRVDIDLGWSVRTGHDEALERVAAALGGGATCIGALQAVLPGLRMWWQRAGRETGLGIRSPDHAATWVSSQGVLPCCPAAGFDDPHLAAAHVRDVPHVAAVTGVSRRDLRAAVTGLGPEAARAAALSESVDDLTADAWSCGLDPAWVQRVRTDLAAGDPTTDAAGVPRPISVELLLAIAQTGADPGWLSRHCGADDTLEWLAWTCTDLDADHPNARGQWLATGARRSDIVALSEAGYQAGTATEVARTWGLSVPGTAKLLARWCEVGYRPTATQFQSVAEVGVGYPPAPPAVSAVERVARALGVRRPTEAQRTTLAIALVRCGTVPDTVAMLRTSRAGDRGREPEQVDSGSPRARTRAHVDV